jgi:ribosome-associated protein
MYRGKVLTTKQTAVKAARLCLEVKAHDVLTMNLKKLTTVADYFVVCSGDSDVQVKAIADRVKEGLKKEGLSPWHDEGYKNRSWILLDYVDVVVHIFHRDARVFYNLEKLWGDAKIERVSDTGASVEKTGGKKKSAVRK